MTKRGSRKIRVWYILEDNMIDALFDSDKEIDDFLERYHLEEFKRAPEWVAEQ